MTTVNLGKVQGDSAYQIARNNGFSGTEKQWLSRGKSFEILTEDPQATELKKGRTWITPKTVIIPPALMMESSGTFINVKTISLSSDKPSIIWYTLDGTNPIVSETRIQYTTPFNINATTRIKAYAIDVTGNESDMLESIFTKIQSDHIYFNGDSNSYLRLPNFTMDTIEIEAKIASYSADSYIFDARAASSAILYLEEATKSLKYGGGTLTLEGVPLGISSSSGPLIEKKYRYKFKASNSFTNNVTIFARQSGVANLKGELYSVKCYLAEELVAHYDMTTGTVNDISGNNRNATLMGGTWRTSEVVNELQYNHIVLNGLEERISIIPPIGTKFIYLKMKRLNNDEAGYIVDLRPVSASYVFSGGSAGIVDVTFNGVASTPLTSNHLLKISTNSITEVMVQLSTATVNNNFISIGTRTQATQVSEEDYSNVEVYDVKFYDTSMGLLDEYKFNNGIGDKTLYSRLLDMRGGTNGQWVYNV